MKITFQKEFSFKEPTHMEKSKLLQWNKQVCFSFNKHILDFILKSNGHKWFPQGPEFLGGNEPSFKGVDWEAEGFCCTWKGSSVSSELRAACIRKPFRPHQALDNPLGSSSEVSLTKIQQRHTEQIPTKQGKMCI